MQWEGGAQSGNVEDRRGMGGKLAVGGAGGVVLLILGLIFGVDLGGGAGVRNPGGDGPPPANDKTKQFYSAILGYTEQVWKDQFSRGENGYGRRYQEPKLVIFDHAVDTGCGRAPSSVGPFYCPADQNLYIDPSFFEELEQKLGGSKAEFSQAYVIAHEVGHHVQNLLGYSDRADEARRQGKEEGNRASVRLELQADYLAGAWAHHANKLKPGLLEPGDREEALRSARAIGDDRLQKRGKGWASPESYTHGTSEQRMKFFDEGLKTGNVTKSRLNQFFTARYDTTRGELVME
jgi:predicted metalloprotease